LDSATLEQGLVVPLFALVERRAERPNVEVCVCVCVCVGVCV
jgi:hypothetical protein